MIDGARKTTISIMAREMSGGLVPIRVHLTMIDGFSKVEIDQGEGMPTLHSESVALIRGSTPDLETFRTMLNRSGIEFTERPDKHSSHVTNVEVEDGYPRFVSVLSFDKDGALKRVAAWE